MMPDEIPQEPHIADLIDVPVCPPAETRAIIEEELERIGPVTPGVPESEEDRLRRRALESLREACRLEELTDD